MRVVISQRVDWHSERGERRDALDQTWGPALEAIAGQPVALLPLPNRSQAARQTLELWNPHLLVLSGGNDLGEAPDRDQTEAEMLHYAIKAGLPVLAVCRGMQMLQCFLGGTLERVPGHVGCEHTVHVASDAGQLADFPTRLRVNSYHGWGILENALAPRLQAIYLHDDGSVEAACHVERPWLAVMWHPERTALGEPAAGAWIGRWLREVLA